MEALESYSSHLESSFVKIKLPPTDPNANIPPTFDLSPSYVAVETGVLERVAFGLPRTVPARLGGADFVPLEAVGGADGVFDRGGGALA